MKSISKILVLILFTQLTTSLEAQNFLTQGNTWVFEHFTWPWGYPNPTNQSIESIRVQSDTTILGRTYKILDITKNHPCSVFSHQEFLREDNGKVYRLNRDQTEEYLMFDFLEKDSFEIPYDHITVGNIPRDTAYAMVDSFGFETDINGNEMKTQYLRIKENNSLSDDFLYKVYQSVGFAEGGMLFPDLSTGLCDVIEGSFLKCHISGSDTLKFGEGDCDEVTIYSNLEEHTENMPSVFPNPVEDFLQIGHIPHKQYSLYNSSGLKVLSGGQIQQINMRDLQHGLYFLELRNENQQISTHKILKQ